LTDKESSLSFENQLCKIENSHFCADGLDALVINAGVAEYRPLEAETPEHYCKMMAINVKSHYFLIQRLRRHLERRGGAITVVSSIITNNPLPHSSLYAMTKGALDAMALSLAAEFAPTIRVNIVSPGATDTPLIDKFGIPKAHRAEFVDSASENIPLRRFGSPDDIASVIVSQLGAEYVTGSNWVVDGGVSITSKS
jgi:NAD(P)-dependent dehydrogenase (short-subunit alcohol dehydrogenase family)